VEDSEDKNRGPVREIGDQISGACPEAKAFEGAILIAHTAYHRVLGDKQEGVLEIIGESERCFFAALGKIGSSYLRIGGRVLGKIEWECQLAGLSNGFLRARCCSDSTHRRFPVDDSSGGEVFHAAAQLILHIDSPSFLLFQLAETFADDLGSGVVAAGGNSILDEFFEFGGE
jgi:hypothetical protein